MNLIQIKRFFNTKKKLKKKENEEDFNKIFVKNIE